MFLTIKKGDSFICGLCLHLASCHLVWGLVCCCWCLVEVFPDRLMSCLPTVLSIWFFFLPWGHLQGAQIICLFIQHNSDIILALEQYYSGMPYQPPCCVWKLILLFIPALTFKSTVTCRALSQLPWDTLIKIETSILPEALTVASTKPLKKTQIFSINLLITIIWIWFLTYSFHIILWKQKRAFKPLLQTKDFGDWKIFKIDTRGIWKSNDFSLTF